MTGAPARLLVVIPTYNESTTIGTVLWRLLALPLDLHVLIVDDDSPDDTAGIARRTDNGTDRVHALVRPVRHGLGSAIRQGIAWGIDRGYELIASMDGDGSHDPSCLVAFVAQLDATQADGVIGSRYVQGGGIRYWPLTRRLLSASANAVARTLLRTTVHDLTSGFQLYRRSTLERVALYRHVSSDGYAFQMEIKRLLLNRGSRLVEAPIIFTDRIGGRSKLTARHIAEAAGKLWRLWRHARAIPEADDGGRPAQGVDVLDESTLPTVSVVMPLPPDGRTNHLLSNVAQLRYPAERLEVIVAEGRAPSAQRNRAASVATGDVLYFLDSDARPAAETLRRLVCHHLNDSSVAAVGGPSCVPEHVSSFEQSAADVIASAAHGACRARYHSIGSARRSSEQELILCNLSVRRSAWHGVGGFHEALFPNEENEWLRRAAHHGFHVIYEPSAVVYRLPRNSWSAFCRQFFTYGRGRAKQSRIEGARGNRRYAVPLALGGAWLLLLAVAPIVSRWLLTGYMVWLSAIMWPRVLHRRSWLHGIRCVGLGVAMHASYAIGYLIGWLERRRVAPTAEHDVRVYWVKRFGVNWKGVDQSAENDGCPAPMNQEMPQPVFAA